MANKKLSEETAGAAITGASQTTFRAVQSGSSVKVTDDQLKTFIHQGNLPFPATQVASGDANTLDDYEEGTWTPVMGDGTNNYTLSGHSGSYTKIGDTVTAWFQCPWTSIGSAGASQLRISGLPFTSASFAPAFFREMSGLDFTATLNLIIAGTSGGTQIEFFRVVDNGNQTNLAANSSSASGAVRGCVVYKV